MKEDSTRREAAGRALGCRAGGLALSDGGVRGALPERVNPDAEKRWAGPRLTKASFPSGVIRPGIRVMVGSPREAASMNPFYCPQRTQAVNIHRADARPGQCPHRDRQIQHFCAARLRATDLDVF